MTIFSDNFHSRDNFFYKSGVQYIKNVKEQLIADIEQQKQQKIYFNGIALDLFWIALWRPEEGLNCKLFLYNVVT